MRTEPLGHTSGFDRTPWTAKFADFGSSFARKEVDEGGANYAGTVLYNAPEIEGYTENFVIHEPFEGYKMADVYSFGILIWEILNNGNFFLSSIDSSDSLLCNRRYREYLRKSYLDGGDSILESAIQYIQTIRDEPVDFQIYNTLESVLKCSIRTNPTHRMPMKLVEAILWKNAREERPPITHSLPRLSSGPSQQPPSRVIPKGGEGGSYTKLAHDTYGVRFS
ncbi:hypothetical protein CC78DRAFT_570751 [Lojkania enalia]|uniref:Protein kinase domain-containing protein n=1 Tax=Lojkania enalia TaxID=147567 RepID=A0A9P4K1D2_9PLEO|nr:hypothetical protein CC78DRAFT_570751 [Didymosphaeria enalia]